MKKNFQNSLLIRKRKRKYLKEGGDQNVGRLINIAPKNSPVFFQKKEFPVFLESFRKPINFNFFYRFSKILTIYRMIERCKEKRDDDKKER